MGEQIVEAASKLVPLLLLLAGIFGALIITIIVLRLRLGRATRTGGAGRQPGDRASLRPEDVVTVLGKTMTCSRMAQAVTQNGQSSWCRLESEDGPALLYMPDAGEEAFYFPGRADRNDPAPFPESIEQEQRVFKRAAEAAELAAGWKIAFYAGPDGRCLAVEQFEGGLSLWRGKSIPIEGVRVLEEK